MINQVEDQLGLLFEKEKIMTKIKFFNKSDKNLESYRKNFKKALNRISIVKLFDKQIIIYLENWLDNQKSYIIREDVNNLWKNMDLIYIDKDFYDYVSNWLKFVKNNWNILEYSFNLISELDELAKKYSKYKKKNDFGKKLKKEKLESRIKDENEINKLLNNL